MTPFSSLLVDWPGRPRAEGTDPVGARRPLDTPEGPVAMYLLDALGSRAERHPASVKVLLENVLRLATSERQVDEAASTLLGGNREPGRAVGFTPARVLLQDHSGLPVLQELAGMRSALARRGRDPAALGLSLPADLVVDHSVQVDVAGVRNALAANMALEYERNRERYEFLRWAAGAFPGLRVVPPGRGIVHQINLERLATVVALLPGSDGPVAVPDTVLGTDSHTPMVNGLGVLGWGVGGVEAEAVLLGQPLPLPAPRVVGVRLLGEPRPGVMATDLVLTITQRLREHGVVSALVEFHGAGCASLAVPDRATISNMAPEYGATAALFPVDGRTLEYLAATGRPRGLVGLVERYAKAQGLFRDAAWAPRFAESIDVDLSAVEPSVAGPRRPQQRMPLSRVPVSFAEAFPSVEAAGEEEPGHGAVAIAAISSCTNTSNPVVMLAAGLLARRALERGLRVRPWVKASLAPGSRVVARYLRKCGLLDPLERVGFNLVAFGCTTCIGNSGPLLPSVEEAVRRRGVVPVAVLSGNRNFEGRIHSSISASYLASPPLVVAYALAGTIRHDLMAAPLALDRAGRPVHLSDLWPSASEVAGLARAITPDLFVDEYRGLFDADGAWSTLEASTGPLFDWRQGSTYLVEPSLPEPASPRGAGVELLGCRVLAALGHAVTTDHISPAGAIGEASPAGRHLAAQGVAVADFNTYGCRRGNHEVMVAGTFANRNLQNHLAGGRAGGWTTHLTSGEVVSIPEAAGRYRREGVPLLVLAGRDYGMGSSRDWAARGQAGLGVRAVLAESFERIHRSNLVGCGVLPLQFQAGEGWASLGLDGTETFDIACERLVPGASVRVVARGAGGRRPSFQTVCRIDSEQELAWYRSGGVVAFSVGRVLDSHAVAGGARP